MAEDSKPLVTAEIVPPDVLRVTVDYNAKTGAVSVAGPKDAPAPLVAGIFALGYDTWLDSVKKPKRSIFSL